MSELNTQPSTTRVAPPPFNKPSADLILRSCDKVDFYVRKAVMTEASSVFEDIFTSPQRAGGAEAHGHPEAADRTTLEEGNLCIVQMTEHSRVLEHVLRFVYPVDRPTIRRLEDALDVLKMGNEFMMECVKTGALHQYEALAKLQPLEAYAMACKRRNGQAMRIAAKACLTLPIPDMNNFVDVLDGIPTGAYVRLQKYHSKCSAAVQTLKVEDLAIDLSSVSWIKKYDRCWILPVALPAFARHPSQLRQVPDKWWVECLMHFFDVLNRTPHPDVLRSLATKAAFVVQGFTLGRLNVTSPIAPDVEDFIVEFADAVEARLHTVELEIR